MGEGNEEEHAVQDPTPADGLSVPEAKKDLAASDSKSDELEQSKGTKRKVG